MTNNNENSNIPDPDLELINARKMKALKEQFASKEKEKKIMEQNELIQKKSTTAEGGVSERDFLISYLYDRGNEVLDIAEQQFPFQTKIIIKRFYLDSLSPSDQAETLSAALFGPLSHVPREVKSCGMTQLRALHSQCHHA